MNNQVEIFAEALRNTQEESGVNISPEDALVIWNDYEFDEVCGFKVVYCPTITKCTLVLLIRNEALFKLIRIFEDYMG